LYFSWTSKESKIRRIEKMWIARLPSGLEIDVSGGLRVLEIENGFYVVGQEMLISVNSREEGLEEIRKLKQNEC
jgi:hypothetical protein